MLVLFITLAVIFLFTIEHKWAIRRLEDLQLHSRLNLTLAEPGEIVRLDNEVANRSRYFPTLVRLIEYLPDNARIVPDCELSDGYIFKLSKCSYVNRSFMLNPKRKRNFHVNFVIRERGRHFISRYELCSGDLFGLNEKQKHLTSRDYVAILPQRTISPDNLRILGSFLGDISVRRFIMEDPVLTIGFNDYTGREPMKQISWTRSASAGQLKVRQYDHTVNQTVTVIMNLSVGTNAELEEVFSTVRMVAEQLETRHIAFSLITNTRLEGGEGTMNTISEGLGETHLNAVLYALACAEYTCYYSFEALVQNLISKASAETTYIVVTAPLEGSEAEALGVLNAFCSGRVCPLTCGK